MKKSNDDLLELGDIEELEIGLSWDLFGEKQTDLDATCILFNVHGQIYDAVYYNQLEIPNVLHSGDSLDGSETGYDEKISINFSNLDPDIKCFMIVINCYSGGTFENVETAKVEIIDPKKKDKKNEILLGCKGSHTGFIFCMIYKEEKSGSWYIKKVGKTAGGRHFLEMKSDLENVLSSIINIDIIKSHQTKGWTGKEKKHFDIEKGQSIKLGKLNYVFLGLGWDSRCDLDSSCISVTENGDILSADVVKFGHLKNFSGSIKHSGDNLTGAGSGDDERISVELDKIDPDIKYLFFVITVFTNKNTFKDVKGAYCRLVDKKTKKVVCKYTLKEMGNNTCQIMCCLIKEQKTWRLQSLGTPSEGRVSNDSKVFNSIKRILKGFKGFIFTAEAVGIPKMDLLGKSDPYFYIVDQSNDNIIYRSECIEKTLNPDWKRGYLDSKFVNYKTELRCVIYDQDKISSDDYIGEFNFKITDIIHKKKTEFKIIDMKTKKKNRGTFKMKVFESVIRPLKFRK